MSENKDKRKVDRDFFLRRGLDTPLTPAEMKYVDKYVLVPRDFDEEPLMERRKESEMPKETPEIHWINR